ncbi:unnamed protein product [Echinostoma caproni]|uniref:Aromatic-L-amino-acid decarboxylase n=1 Tax=Echinostoma caproni TaxID=27848 RepID=A0A3P8I4L7_9TREM|nr:unnamed protein product [Echinostoma caproni]
MELIMTDWVAKLLDLPEEFTHASGKGGGVIQFHSAMDDPVMNGYEHVLSIMVACYQIKVSRCQFKLSQYQLSLSRSNKRLGMHEHANLLLRGSRRVALDTGSKHMLPVVAHKKADQHPQAKTCSASDCMLVCMLAARHHAIQRHKHVFQEKGDPNPENAVLSRLVAYGSNLAHSCVEKASVICVVKFHQIDVDENYSVRGEALQVAMEEDIKNGLIPFFVCATLGTTACCSFDDLKTIGPVCDNFNVWLHVDGAYAGNALICPEFRHYLQGIEHVWSMNINPNKWMLVGFDCSLMW